MNFYTHILFESTTPEPKDIKRILDIIKKSNGDDVKAAKLAETMANKIKDMDKLERRYNAAVKELGANHPVALEFKRIMDLNNINPASTPSITTTATPASTSNTQTDIDSTVADDTEFNTDISDLVPETNDNSVNVIENNDISIQDAHQLYAEVCEKEINSLDDILDIIKDIELLYKVSNINTPELVEKKKNIINSIDFKYEFNKLFTKYQFSGLSGVTVNDIAVYPSHEWKPELKWRASSDHCLEVTLGDYAYTDKKRETYNYLYARVKYKYLRHEYIAEFNIAAGGSASFTSYLKIINLSYAQNTSRSCYVTDTKKYPIILNKSDDFEWHNVTPETHLRIINNLKLSIFKILLNNGWNEILSRESLREKMKISLNSIMQECLDTMEKIFKSKYSIFPDWRPTGKDPGWKINVQKTSLQYGIALEPLLYYTNRKNTNTYSWAYETLMLYGLKKKEAIKKLFKDIKSALSARLFKQCTVDPDGYIIIPWNLIN